MLQVHEFSSDRETLPQPTLWAESRRGNRLDCETAVLLRQKLSPVFETASSWSELRVQLKSHGFDLRFENERLILVETLRGTKICSCRFLGHPLASLVTRLGRVRARPPKPTSSFGQITL